MNGYNRSLWDDIAKHADEMVANKLVLPQGIDVELLKRNGYWLLRHISIHLDRSQGRLYSPKFYAFKAPSTPPFSSSEELNCEYGMGDRKQKYFYALTCKYENDQVAVIREEIAVQNYRPDVAVPPLSDDDVYAPTIVTVPNGTNVGVVNEQVIDYMWQDGRIVRRIDRKAINATNSASFHRNSHWRFILAGACLIGLLLIIGTRIWLCRKAKASS